MSSTKWVVVGLSSAGERETNIEAMTAVIRRVLGAKLEVFVPAISKKAREESQTTFYMDGYIFVKYQDGISYTKLQDMAYFDHVLCCRSKGVISYSLVEDEVLNPLREGVENLSTCIFAIGDHVKVVRGEFRLLKGVVCVIHDGGETVLVDVSQRSKLMMIDFPVTYLEKIEL